MYTVGLMGPITSIEPQLTPTILCFRRVLRSDWMTDRYLCTCPMARGDTMPGASGQSNVDGYVVYLFTVKLVDNRGTDNTVKYKLLH